MTETSIRLQELRRRIYLKAKAEKTWRFWRLYVHVCKMETLETAYKMAKKNRGASGVDGKTFTDIERGELEGFLTKIKEELTKLGVEINEEKTRIVDIARGESFRFLGFNYKRIKTRNGKTGALVTPSNKARGKIIESIKEVFQKRKSQPIKEVIEQINPQIRGWVNYFRYGNTSRCFSTIRDWIERKVRRHMMKARGRKGFGWKRWSKDFIYKTLGLFNDYKIRRYEIQKALPAQ